MSTSTPRARAPRRPDPPALPKLASLEIAAELLNIEVRSVRRMAARGEIRVYRVGPKLLKCDLNELRDKFLTPVPPESVSG